MTPFICPDCGFGELTEDFQCYYCDDLFAEKVSKTQTVLTPNNEDQIFNMETLVKKIHPSLVVGILSIAILALLLSGFAPKLRSQQKGKPLAAVRSQLHSPTKANKFKIERDAKNGLTYISLTQENIKLGTNTDSLFNVTLLFDCIAEDQELTATPGQYSVSVLSANNGWKFLDLNQFDIKSDEDIFTLEGNNKNSWVDGKKVFEYMTYSISRVDLEGIADSNETHIRIGEYDGQITAEQKQALKLFLNATTVERQSK